jgi:nucleoporin NDC1
MGDVRKASTSEIQLLLHSILPLASSAGLTVSVTLFAGSIVYFSIFRARIWALWYSFMKQFINLGKTTKPTGVAPFIPLVSRFLVEGALLLFLWQFSNVAFNTLMAREPLKDGKPITGDSKDPNGSLLNGLKSKKEDNKVCRQYSDASTVY